MINVDNERITYVLEEGEGRVGGKKVMQYCVGIDGYPYAHPAKFIVSNPVGNPPHYPVLRVLLENNEKGELIDVGHTPRQASSKARQYAIAWLEKKVGKGNFIDRTSRRRGLANQQT